MEYGWGENWRWWAGEFIYPVFKKPDSVLFMEISHCVLNLTSLCWVAEVLLFDLCLWPFQGQHWGPHVKWQLMAAKSRCWCLECIFTAVPSVIFFYCVLVCLHFCWTVELPLGWVKLLVLVPYHWCHLNHWSENDLRLLVYQ